MNALDKIVKSNRMPVLFVGSGISRRYLQDYPDWNELLQKSFDMYNKDSYQYQKYIDKYRREGLTDFEINAKMGTIIENEFNEAFFDTKIKLNFIKTKNPAWVKRGVSPYKMYLSNIFKKLPLKSANYLNKEKELFQNLKNKVSAVITTNYDQFLEKEIFNNDYTVFRHQYELFSADSYNSAEIYKIHGCVTDADSIIITEKDYKEFTDSRKLVIAKMLTLFSESPIVFLGYSFTDENIRNIVADFLSCLTNEQLDNIDEHFVFISFKKGERKLIETKNTIILPNGQKIPVTEIQTDNYLKVFSTLNKVVPGISPIRIRDTKRIVRKIVDENLDSANAESIIVGLDDLDNMDLSSKPLAIAVGYRDNILNKYGYGLVDTALIFEDIIYDNKNFSAKEMCTVRFKSIPCNLLMPVYKYIKKANYTLIPDSHLKVYVDKHSTIDLILGTSVKKTISKLPHYTNFNELKAGIEEQEDIKKVPALILANIDLLDINTMRTLCKDMFLKSTPELLKDNTYFKRCVMCLDYWENYQSQLKEE